MNSSEFDIMVEKIAKLKKELNAIILAHNYQPPEVQDVADFVGDSLELSLKAMEVDSKIIVFAGVDFMAEQAKILNPDKVVLIPDRGATCSLARMATPELIANYRKKHADAPLIAYVNTYASVKALADYIVTSSSALQLVNCLDAEKVLFTPDSNLALYIAKNSNKEVISIPPFGHCYVHMALHPDDINKIRTAYPSVEILAHPETSPEVQDLADFVGSTSQMLRRAKISNSKIIAMATDKDIVHRARKENSEKQIIPVSENVFCLFMKRINLKKILDSLIKKEYVVDVDRSVAEKVRRILFNTFEVLGLGARPWKK